MLRNALVIIFGLLFLYGLFTIGAPFLLALLIAIFLEPLNGLMVKYLKMNRLVAATVTCTVFIAILLGLVYLLLLKIFSELVSLLRNLNYAELNQLVSDALVRLDTVLADLPPDVAYSIKHYIATSTQELSGLTSRISGITVGALTAVPGLLVLSLVFFVALYLFSFSLTTIKQSFLSFFEERSRGKVEKVLLDLRSAVIGFIRAQAILSLLTFMIAFIGLLILDVRYALAITFVIIVVDILPVLGTGSVLVPWAAYSYIIHGDVHLAVGLLILFLVITVFRRIVEPKILGEQMGIGALASLISLYVGFALVGPIGLILGPIVVIVYQAMAKVGLLKIKIRLE
ncbi:sporulation integral membrane protein YtvI [Paenibacillus thermotolerans]|uniref:sporulation integral membrane protein YtvI n=1 Tax=Paenibacillus thermotolerans TaxID=3027807 RepID=UPI0023681F9A|nr:MULTISPECIES: sporulation integral membrane protein YtvI [unclassified Paenibacillus]